MAETNRILVRQSRYNRSTAQSWDSYAAHRAEIAKLLHPVGITVGGRMCVLGAGNCNDLDLRTLLEQYAEVHLVDLDGAALDRAVARQEVAGAAGLPLHGNIDLTGIAGLLGAGRGRPDDATVARCIEIARACAAPGLGQPFNLVVSPCILSQIVGYAADVLGRDHPRARDLLGAIRDRHLRLIAELLAPGGTGLLVCDMVSSDTRADVAEARRDRVEDLMNRAVAAGTFFPGLAPRSVEQFFRSDPLVAPVLSDVRMLPPWTWQLTPHRTFLVYAARIRRSRGTIVFQSNGQWPSPNGHS